MGEIFQIKAVFVDEVYELHMWDADLHLSRDIKIKVGSLAFKFYRQAVTGEPTNQRIKCLVYSTAREALIALINYRPFTNDPEAYQKWTIEDRAWDVAFDHFIINGEKVTNLKFLEFA